MNFTEQDEFIAKIRAAIIFDEENGGASVAPEFLIECLTTMMPRPFKVKEGRPRPTTKDGLTYEEIGWDGTQKTVGPYGRVLSSDRMETATSMIATFIESIQQRMWIHDHDTIEIRIWPEVNFRAYGRAASFYARLVSYNHAEMLRARKERQPA